MPKTFMHAILHLTKGAAEDNIPLASITPLMSESGVLFTDGIKIVLQHMENMYIFSCIYKI